MSSAGVVLDASIAVSWAFADEENPYADAVADELVDSFALVPPLWHVELANALCVGLRRGRIDEDGVAQFMALIGQLDVRTDVLPPTAGRLAVAAAESGLSAYDTTYLLLAAERSLPLATSDRDLRRAAAAVGVVLVGSPTD